MHDIVIFLGPSLQQCEAEKILSSSVHCRVAYLPPIQRGDLTALLSGQLFPLHSDTSSPPLSKKTIGIIDGLFLETAAVGHREILSALRSGVFVIGSSSMGALRAFELESLGMKGIGKIFHLYRSGIVESDDEVALVCDPVHYIALSEPLVHIRLTLMKMRSEELISSYEHDILFETAKKRYYPERTWDQLFEDLIHSSPSDHLVSQDGTSAYEPIPMIRVAELCNLCQTHAVDQKREDAIALLTYIRENGIHETSS
ncbi:MAG: TfuA-related McrA-glycine thioamidation protein [Methanomicrobiales archaeon]|jgi:hypothetical protein|nr:TfuA-related McrA-glycine thioamidation protein [Methanomicrobiales archaeon]